MIPSENKGMQALRERAYALAETRHFDSAHAVEQALIAEGWSNAGEAMQSDFARKAVTERCQAAKAH